MTRPFLTATWSNLCLFNYSIPPELLRPHLAPALELDTLNGHAFVSLVAFDFLDTRVMGIPFPGFRNFPEINLRFYVRHNGERGVKFIREFVPSGIVAGIARVLYNEPYSAAPMTSLVTQDVTTIKASHCLHFGNNQHTAIIHGQKPTTTPPTISIEHFFKEHEWGFGVNRKGQLIRYRIEHPIWEIYPVASYDIHFDFAQLYGETWGILNTAKPHSVVLAKGSQISVYSSLHVA